jgi:hypothetical protein
LLTNFLPEATAGLGGLAKRGNSLANGIDSTVLSSLYRITDHPIPLIASLVDLKHAADIGEITNGQLAELPALQVLLSFIHL